MTEVVETRLHSTSPPPAPMDYFTAVAAAPDSTTTAARNSDPVTGVSFRPLDNDGNTIGDDPPPVAVPSKRATGKIAILGM